MNKVIVWGYEAPAKHAHPTRGIGAVCFMETEIGSELVLQCACGVHWHTGIAESDELHEIGELKAAAARWLRAEWFVGCSRAELLDRVLHQQLPLPLPDDAAIVRVVLPKRSYYRTPTADLSAQMALPLMAAA